MNELSFSLLAGTAVLGSMQVIGFRVPRVGRTMWAQLALSFVTSLHGLFSSQRDGSGISFLINMTFDYLLKSSRCSPTHGEVEDTLKIS